MIYDFFTQNANSKRQNPFTKVLLCSIFFFLLFQANIYSQNSGNCLRSIYDASNPNYANGSGISTSFTALTVEAWVNSGEVAGSDIRRFVTVGSDAAVLRHDGAAGGIDFYLNFGGGYIPTVYSAGILSGDKWAHIAGTWDGATMRLYVNGKEIGSNTTGTHTTLSTDGTITISKNAVDEQMGTGYIDEVRLWNVARTGDEIRKNMYKELSGSESGLTNYWKLNETSGTTAQDSKGSANLTLYNFGASTYWVNSGAFAGPRNALSFDGTDDYVSINDNASLHLSNTITIEAWVNPSNLNGRFPIYSTRIIDEAGAYQLEIGTGNGGTNRVAVSGKGTWVAETNDNAISTGVWTHIVYTRTGTGSGTSKIYVNGVEQSLISDADYTFVDNNSIKCIGNGNIGHFAGQIDEVRIWNDVRTQAEIAGNMCMTLKGNETGLVGYWRFDQAAGTLAPDLTGTNDGTLNNMTDADWVSANEFNTWIGLNGSNFWNTAGIDWSLGTIPTASDNVGIPNCFSPDVYVNNNTPCKSLSISSGASLTVYSGHTLTISGNALCVGSLDCNSSSDKVNLSGGSSIHNIFASSLDNVELNDASYSAKMVSNCTVNGTLTLTNGDLDLNGTVLTLGSSATLSETAGNTVGGYGELSVTRNLNAPSNLNVAGLGLVITSSADLGSTTISRGHEVQNGGGNSGIKRYYKIKPTNHTGLIASFLFTYDESELNGISESELELFKSTDQGGNWSNAGGTCNTANNQIELTGIDPTAMWTAAASSAPLPVELTSFTAASSSSATVELNWRTATEVNNYGFDVERSAVSGQQSAEISPADRYKLNAESWTKIGFVKGSGNSNSPKSYFFVDTNPISGKVEYRLKQIDNNGGFKYSSVVDVTTLPKEYSLNQNYPNPFNPATTISYQLSAAGNVTLKIYDVLGREVKTLVNEKQNAGCYKIEFNAGNLSSGMYLYRVTAVSTDGKSYKFSAVKKCILVK